MNIRKIEAVDSHTHINHNSPYDSTQNEIYTAYLDDLRLINNAAHINTMLCSTFASVLNPDCILKENEYLFDLCNKYDWLYQWVVIDPRIPNTFKQAKDILINKKCVGIKLHPLYHKYSFKEYAEELCSFASQYNAVMLIHSDIQNIVEYVEFANQYPNVKFIMAHLGNTSYVDAIKQARFENIYTDTSGIASSNNQIVEYAVKHIGSEHILFGTDTYAAGFQRGRIEYALISEKDKENILCNNAKTIFRF